MSRVSEKEGVPQGDESNKEDHNATLILATPVELSQSEEQVMQRIRKAKVFVFLRKHRHELMSEALIALQRERFTHLKNYPAKTDPGKFHYF